MKLQILKEAEVEIESARAHLNRQATELGGRFLDDLEETLFAVSQRPLSFPKVETLPDDFPFRRARLGVFRFVVVFELIDETILVIAVAHTSRDSNYWLYRIRN